MKALIDSDILIYRCGFAGETTTYNVFVRGDNMADGPIATFHHGKREAVEWAEKTIGPDDYVMEKTTIAEPVENVLHSIKNTIELILDKTGADEHVLYLTGKDNFREKVVDYYKANRKDDAKPIHYAAAREYLIEHHGAVVIDGMEADDSLGIEQYNQIMSNAMDEHMEETIICSIDKDLDMIPGWHYNWVKDTKYFVTEEEAIKFFYTQLLTGDPVDNIKGIPGIGPKKAEKLLAKAKTEEEMKEIVTKEYTKVYKDMPLEIMEENRQLLWILREPLNE